MFSGRSPVSRICRVLLFAFLAAIPGLLVTANASSGGVLFQSNWDTALGTSDAAFRDTSAPFGPWTLFEVGGTVGGNPNEMVVVNTTAPVGERNSLRIQQQGSSGNGWCRVSRLNFIPPSTDYYLRFYIRNDDVAGASQDHVVQPGLVGNIYNDLTYLNKGEFAGGWRPRMVLGGNQGPNTSMPSWQLANNTALAYGRWYRFEYWVHFTAAARIQVRVKIYDDVNVLRFTEADFIPDPGWGQWTGATLASYYANSNPGGGVTTFGITPANLVNIEFGNNGSASSSNTGRFWYFAGVQVRDDTWPGPLDGAPAPTMPSAPGGLKLTRLGGEVRPWTAGVQIGGRDEAHRPPVALSDGGGGGRMSTHLAASWAAATSATGRAGSSVREHLGYRGRRLHDKCRDRWWAVA